MELGEIIVAWIRDHVGMLFMGLGGASVALFVSDKHWKEKIASFIVGLILCSTLAPATADFLTGGKLVALFGFFYGIGGMTIAKIIMKVVEKKTKLTLEEKTGVKLDDDNS